MSRRTKILATLGPASWDEQVLRSLIEAGMDAVRLNFAYGTPEEHRDTVLRVRRVSQAARRHVSIVQDLAGRKIRISSMAVSPTFVAAGDDLIITSDEGRTGGSVAIDYPRLSQDARQGDRVLLGDGDVELRVKSVSSASVVCVVVVGGEVRERQGVHFPETRLVVDTLTEKDLADARLGVDLGVDYVSLSFVRSAEDIERLRRVLREAGSETPLIAKIERRDAVENLDGIIEAADGVMVARGDLGLQVQLAEVPLLQKQIISKANRAGKVAITATQMMESMVQNPRPTRAEVSDVANAVLDGTEVAMLSGETAIGAYPVATVGAMARVLERADRETDRQPVSEWPEQPAEVMALSARQLAVHAGAAALAVFTRRGYSARLLANQRPTVPILAFTPSAEVARRMALWRGVTPMLSDWPETPEEMLSSTERLLAGLGFSEGDIIVLARWSALRGREWSNFVHLHRLG